MENCRKNFLESDLNRGLFCSYFNRDNFQACFGSAVQNKIRLAGKRAGEFHAVIDMDTRLIPLLKKSQLSEGSKKNIIKLLEEGATVPFIARYRKEMTGGAGDEELRIFSEEYQYAKNLLEKKDETERLLSEKGRLTPDLKKQLSEAVTLSAVEDLYRPFKEKKNTRAAAAIAKGLEPLADLLERKLISGAELEKEAARFIKKDVKSAEEALQGAMDILAERFSDNPSERESVRNFVKSSAFIEVKASKDLKEEEDPQFVRFDGHAEKAAQIPSHRFLAIMRGTKEKKLSAKVAVAVEQIEEGILRHYSRKVSASAVEAYRDGLKRLMLPSLERELLSDLKEKSDIQAVHTFGRNLMQLLLTPPVTGRVILGVDPAYRTGCKLAVIDENGKFLEHSVIYPVPPKNDYESSKNTVLALAEKYHITGVAIGNGTGSRETQEFFARLNREEKTALKFTVVSEAGASVYSASAVAAEEYPDLDVTVRGAISIAQRLRDPMAALVKIDPKSLGIGQYQHDVDQKLLDRKLYETIEDLVNRVGVDVNSASASLLTYVAGIGPKLAKEIVKHRESKGPFRSKKDLLKVKGLGEKAFEQCAGFLRIREGDSVLDNTGVHPESYSIASQLLDKKNLAALTAELKSGSISDVQSLSVNDSQLIKTLSEKLNCGSETLKDIVKELQKPGFDPRSDLPDIPFRDDLTDIHQLKPGAVISGVVRNITDFGAFVDIGLKNDALIHISEISEQRISHPLEVLSVNHYLPQVRVISVDAEKGRVGLSLKPG